MNKPVWLKIEEVKKFLGYFSKIGATVSEIRDQGLLISAVNWPKK